MDEAERCSRVGLMYAGRLIVCDTPTRIRNLVDGELLALRPDNLQNAGATLRLLPGVLEVQTYGDQLHIFVDDAARRQDEIVACLTTAGIHYGELRRALPRMEEAFISLINKRAGEVKQTGH